MKLKTKIYLLDDDGKKFMGIGVLWLLRAIEETGSLRQGAQTLSISYTKAYTMISSLEAQLSLPVIERRKGGNTHAGASLTPFGKAYLHAYDEFQNEIKGMSISPFTRFSDKVSSLIEEYQSNDKE